MERLPLASLRTFSAVARLLSVTRAAEELHVTPSAVSHHLKALEDYVGTKLLKRAGNRISLTPAGARYANELEDALFVLANATRAVKAARDRVRIRIGCPPSIAMLWLVPRVSRYMREHPELSLAVTMSSEGSSISPMGSEYDMHVCYGRPDRTGWRVFKLGGNNRFFPICSPRLYEEAGLQSPSSLADHALLDSSDETYYRRREPRQPGWHRWLEAAGIPELATARYLNFTPRAYMHSAVREGLGVGLSRTMLAADELEAGKVVVPFGPALELPFRYSLVCSHDLAQRREIALFCEWLIDEAEQSCARVDVLLREQIGLAGPGRARSSTQEPRLRGSGAPGVLLKTDTARRPV